MKKSHMVTALIQELEAYQALVANDLGEKEWKSQGTTESRMAISNSASQEARGSQLL
jgi:hypothetical protein